MDKTKKTKTKKNLEKKNETEKNTNVCFSALYILCEVNKKNMLFHQRPLISLIDYCYVNAFGRLFSLARNICQLLMSFDTM